MRFAVVKCLRGITTSKVTTQSYAIPIYFQNNIGTRTKQMFSYSMHSIQFMSKKKVEPVDDKKGNSFEDGNNVSKAQH